jgi:hypothetical protein
MAPDDTLSIHPSIFPSITAPQAQQADTAVDRLLAFFILMILITITGAAAYSFPVSLTPPLDAPGENTGK